MSLLTYATNLGDLVLCWRYYQRLMARWRRVLPADRLVEFAYGTSVESCAN
jgi:hypothetical protein